MAKVRTIVQINTKEEVVEAKGESTALADEGGDSVMKPRINSSLAEAIKKTTVTRVDPVYPPEWRDFRGNHMTGIDMRNLGNKVDSPERLLAKNEGDKKVVWLRHADFTGADISDSNFSGMDMQGSRFVNCKLGKSNMRGCDLRWCDFSGTDVSEVDFTGALVNEAVGLRA